MSLNSKLAGLFERMAQIMEIKGANPFKSIAFHKVARVLRDLTVDVKQCCADGTIKEIQGIGEGSRKVILEYVKEGRSADYEELAASVPAGLIPMLQIPSLGPKTIALLWKERAVTSIDELKKAIEEGKLAGVKGVGEKKIQAIKDGIELLARSAGRMGIAEALPVAQSLLAQVRKIKGVKRAEAAGSLRRFRETVGDVDLVCAVSDQAEGEFITGEFVKLPEVSKVLGQGGAKASVLTAGGLQVDLRIVPVEHYGATLLYFTGSKEHNVRLRGRAIDMGLTLNEWGLYRIEKSEVRSQKSEEAEGDGKRPKSGGRVEKQVGHAPTAKAVAAKTEEAVYEALDLQFVPPELREDRGEIEAAEKRAIPELITVAHIRGDLHTHTTASDGVNTIEEMAEAARERGYAFLAITDHSKSQVIANGLNEERLLAHVKAIHKAGERIKGIKLLAGCEVDILVDGRLDFDESILKELDIVVASPHVSLSQDEKKATDRIVRAIETRYVNIIGHPTGRVIGRRDGLPLDFARVYAAAAKAGVALEINAGWPRLDLSDVNARGALRAGCKLAIDTDAHATDGFEEIGWGIGVARRAWATPGDVINCLSFEELKGFIGKKR
ncbi:MAG TPA: PHP domain-containing protein [Tepidisphaeraceae bacterium]|nr:PHP domain-containing protein [Tepidisphaeraceae bacterium]